MANKGGPKKASYDKAYNATPEHKKERAQRNAARRDYEAKHGDLPSTVDVDHKKRIAHGGGNDPKNLRAIPETQNAAWRRGKKGYDK